MTIGTATYAGSVYNLIYEDTQDLVWLDYTRAKNSWQNQVDWAASLNTSGTLTYNLDSAYSVDWNDTVWRLPATDESIAYLPGDVAGFAGPDATGYHNYAKGYNMTNSEMGRLFDESLDNLALRTTDGTYRDTGSYGLLNVGLFQNLVQPTTADPIVYYWSSTRYSLDSNQAWGFNFTLGALTHSSVEGWAYGIAVRSATVSKVPDPDPPVAPVPGAALLGLLGLTTAIGRIRRTAR
jgi:hypothetical protein